MPTPRKGQAAAGIGVAAAAAAGIGLTRHRRSARSAAGVSRAYRLEPGEALTGEVRRAALGQLEIAREDLRNASGNELPHAVHETRKRLKRLRALLRLVRPAIGEGVYARVNAAFRDTAKRLAAARDAKVLADTLDEV